VQIEPRHAASSIAGRGAGDCEGIILAIADLRIINEPLLDYDTDAGPIVIGDRLACSTT